VTPRQGPSGMHLCDAGMLETLFWVRDAPINNLRLQIQVASRRF
jgi:hypothetical protein